MALATAAAATAGVLDQSQPVFGNFAVGNCSLESLAQTFTSGLTGNLDQVDLGIQRDESDGMTTSSPLIISIQTVSGGVPTGTTLTSASLPPLSIPPIGSARAFFSVPLGIPAAVTANVQYAIVVSGVSDPCGGITGGYFWSAGGSSDVYPGGDALILLGGTWCAVGCISDGRIDFTFQTYVASPIAVHCHSAHPHGCRPH